MYDTLIRAIVKIDKIFFEVTRQCLSVHCISVILASDVTATRSQIQRWDVVL